MTKKKTTYQGLDWLDVKLPEETENWLGGGRKSVNKDPASHRSLKTEIERVRARGKWKWPSRRTIFLSDIHADTDALMASLVASGGIRKTGPKDGDFALTKVGRASQFVIGGDFVDKGPSNLRLLRAVQKLKKRGARLRILAGNHDVRMFLGVQSLGIKKKPWNEHFFIRSGPKMVPFLKEIYKTYLEGGGALKSAPRTRDCRRALYPSAKWFDEFPNYAGWVMPDSAIRREVKRLRKKADTFEEDCADAGLSLRMAYLAALKWQNLFLSRKGEFRWLYRDMDLVHRDKSFLFLHAGLDDRIARLIDRTGLKRLNKLFYDQMLGDPFDLYYGPLANMIRTKYRPTDNILTRHGADLIHDMGIHTVVHGHLNLCNGQRLTVRKGIVNFECDATLNRNSRRKEGLKGYGAAATIIDPKKWIRGISNDYPYIKEFRLD